MKKVALILIGVSLTLSTFGSTALVGSGGYAENEMSTVVDTEYWALLVAVGVYAYTPDMDIPYMLVEVDDLYDTLLVSDHWTADHIKVIKGENATVLNIFNGFKWLDQHEDENDICLVYLTTHGFPILFDLPPRDEEDRMDEALAAHRGFLPFENPWSWEPLANPLGVITDDAINYFLNRLDAQGTCLIVDSCHSGGFNDNWSYEKKFHFHNFARDLGISLKGKNRVVISSVREQDVSGVGFSYFLTEAMKGYGDDNNDELCSAEEAFLYAKSEIKRISLRWYPQIFDDYPGELIITETELPPSVPLINGTEIGKTNTTYSYQLTAEDPNNDRIQFFIDWGDGFTETSDLIESGQHISLSHSWGKDGTYTIKIKPQDEHGAKGDFSILIVTMADKYVIDQRQVNGYYSFLINDTWWLAQSFRPSIARLGKIELGLITLEENFEIKVMIREELNGSDIATYSLIPPRYNDWSTLWAFPEWIMCDSFDIDVTPNRQYYAVLSTLDERQGAIWIGEQGDPYNKGSFYLSHNKGESWQERSAFDGCFVTYG